MPSFDLATGAPVPIVVSPGEFQDRLSILRIKARRITDKEKLDHVCRELALLGAARVAHLPVRADIDVLAARLETVNEELWEVGNTSAVCRRRNG